MQTLQQDLHYGLRRLLKDPARCPSAFAVYNARFRARLVAKYRGSETCGRERTE